jgi:hypothetical protein
MENGKIASNLQELQVVSSSLLVLNFNKTHYVDFRTKNYYEVKTKVTYDHINISNSTETKFF